MAGHLLRPGQLDGEVARCRRVSSSAALCQRLGKRLPVQWRPAIWPSVQLGTTAAGGREQWRDLRRGLRLLTARPLHSLWCASPRKIDWTFQSRYFVDWDWGRNQAISVQLGGALALTAWEWNPASASWDRATNGPAGAVVSATRQVMSTTDNNVSGSASMSAVHRHGPRQQRRVLRAGTRPRRTAVRLRGSHQLVVEGVVPARPSIQAAGRAAVWGGEVLDLDDRRRPVHLDLVLRPALVRSLRSLSPFGRAHGAASPHPSLAAGQQAGLFAAGEGASAPSRTPDGVVARHGRRPERTFRSRH